MTTPTAAPTRRIVRPASAPSRVDAARAALALAAAADSAAAAAGTEAATLRALARDLGFAETAPDAAAAAAAGLAALRATYQRDDGATRGRRDKVWATLLPVDANGKVANGPLASVARTAVGDALRGATVDADPVFGVMGDNGPSFTTTRPDDGPRTVVGFVGRTVVDPVSALLVAAATGLSCKGAPVGETISKLGKWASRWAQAGETDDTKAVHAVEGVAGAGQRRDRVLAALAAAANADTPKDKRAALALASKAAGAGKDVERRAVLNRRMDDADKLESDRRAYGERLSLPVKAAPVKGPKMRI